MPRNDSELLLNGSGFGSKDARAGSRPLHAHPPAWRGRAARRARLVLFVCVMTSSCGGNAARLEPTTGGEATPIATADAPPSRDENARSTVRVDGIIVHVGGRETLSETQRAYLDRVERVIARIDEAPPPAVPYASDAAAYYAWEPTHRAYVTRLAAETDPLVRAHPRPAAESPEELRFHVLLHVIELHHLAAMHARLVGGRPSGTPSCPSDPPSHYHAVLDRLVRDANTCVQLLGDADEPMRTSAQACARYAAEARQTLSTAAPPSPDDCLEDMPSPGD